MVFTGWVLYLINTKRSVRDFPAALAAKILRHPKRTQNIKGFCGAFSQKATRRRHASSPINCNLSKLFDILIKLFLCCSDNKEHGKPDHKVRHHKYRGEDHENHRLKRYP